MMEFLNSLRKLTGKTAILVLVFTFVLSGCQLIGSPANNIEQPENQTNAEDTNDQTDADETIQDNAAANDDISTLFDNVDVTIGKQVHSTLLDGDVVSEELESRLHEAMLKVIQYRLIAEVNTNSALYVDTEVVAFEEFLARCELAELAWADVDMAADEMGVVLDEIFASMDVHNDTNGGIWTGIFSVNTVHAGETDTKQITLDLSKALEEEDPQTRDDKVLQVLNSINKDENVNLDVVQAIVNAPIIFEQADLMRQYLKTDASTARHVLSQLMQAKSYKECEEIAQGEDTARYINTVPKAIGVVGGGLAMYTNPLTGIPAGIVLTMQGFSVLVDAVSIGNDLMADAQTREIVNKKMEAAQDVKTLLAPIQLLIGGALSSQTGEKIACLIDTTNYVGLGGMDELNKLSIKINDGTVTRTASDGSEFPASGTGAMPLLPGSYETDLGNINVVGYATIPAAWTTTFGEDAFAQEVIIKQITYEVQRGEYNAVMEDTSYNFGFRITSAGNKIAGVDFGQINVTVPGMDDVLVVLNSDSTIEGTYDEQFDTVEFTMSGSADLDQTAEGVKVTVVYDYVLQFEGSWDIINNQFNGTYVVEFTEFKGYYVNGQKIDIDPSLIPNYQSRFIGSWHATPAE